jgi:hypothetical protein
MRLIGAAAQGFGIVRRVARVAASGYSGPFPFARQMLSQAECGLHIRVLCPAIAATY